MAQVGGTRKKVISWLEKNSRVLSALGGILGLLTFIGGILGFVWLIAGVYYEIPDRIERLEEYHKSDQTVDRRLKELEVRTNVLSATFDKTGMIDLSTIMEKFDQASRERQALNGRISQVNLDLSGKLEAQSEELRGLINTNMAELKGKIETTEARLEGKVKTLETELKSEMRILNLKLGKLDSQTKLSWAATKLEAREAGFARYANGLWSLTEKGRALLAQHDLDTTVQGLIVSAANTKGKFDESLFLERLLEMVRRKQAYFQELAAGLKIGMRQLVGTMLVFAHERTQSGTNGAASRDGQM